MEGFCPCFVRLSHTQAEASPATKIRLDHVTCRAYFPNSHTNRGRLIFHSQLIFNLSTSKHHYHSILFRPLRSERTQPLQMARTRSSKKESSGSPKRTRKGKGKATVSETESASISPKRTRQGKAAASKTESVDFNNEDYNIRSPERTKLLTKIKSVVNNAPVSSAFWACCQLADMNRLQIIAKSDRNMILVNENSMALIALQCELLGF